MKIEINAMGLTCPLPVVNTKKAIQSMTEPGVVEVLVDNEIAVQNLTKFAAQRDYAVAAVKQEEQKYLVKIEVKNTPSNQEQSAESETEQPETACTPDLRKNDFVVVLSSNQMGNGAEELGKSLMKAFVFALTKQDQLPKTILLYNSGAYLSIEGADTLEDLKLLEAEGVEILTCGTCLNFYGLTEKLAVGSATNMYEIVEKMEQAGKVIRP